MPVSQVLTSLINFFIQAAMYLIFWVYFFATGSGVHLTLWLLAVPFVILEVMLLGLGVGIIVSSLTTKYRDLAIAVGFGVQLWMYASPVVYPLSMLESSPRLKVLVQLNPMTYAHRNFPHGYAGHRHGHGLWHRVQPGIHRGSAGTGRGAVQPY